MGLNSSCFAIDRVFENSLNESFDRVKFFPDYYCSVKLEGEERREDFLNKTFLITDFEFWFFKKFLERFSIPSRGKRRKRKNFKRFV